MDGGTQSPKNAHDDAQTDGSGAGPRMTEGTGFPQEDEQNRNRCLADSEGGPSPIVVVRSFRFDGGAVRAFTKRGELWFAAADICDALKLTDSTKVVRHIKDCNRGLETIQTVGGPQIICITNERGLYELIFRSRCHGAKAVRQLIARVVGANVMTNP
jgi:hypothetical protein